MLSSTLREKSVKYFFHWKGCLFSQKIVFSTASYVLKDCSFKFQKNSQNTLWNFRKGSVTFVMFEKTGTNRPKSFLHWKLCLFLAQLCVFNKLLGPKVLIILLPQSPPENLMDPYNFLPEFCHARWYKKNWSINLLSLEKAPFFLKNFCFQQRRRSKRIDLNASTFIAKRPYGPF